MSDSPEDEMAEFARRVFARAHEDDDRFPTPVAETLEPDITKGNLAPREGITPTSQGNDIHSFVRDLFGRSH